VAEEVVGYELEERDAGGDRRARVAVLRLDDGKANALSYAALEGLGSGLDRAARDGAGAVVLLGRPGRFSAGFDLGVMRQGPREAADLALTGAALAVRLFESPVPVVLGVTGHALAMGAVLCLAADERVGAAGAFKLGLNEVAIGLALPSFAIELARERLSPRHLQRATAGAEVYDPDGAVEAGFLDRVVEAEAVDAAVRDRAAAWAAGLDAVAHRETKKSLRAPALARLQEGLAADRERLARAWT